jgi:hypothetical protein
MFKNREKNTKTRHSDLNTIIKYFLPLETEELISTEEQNAFGKNNTGYTQKNGAV